jgi:hypothetical protein
VSSKRPAGEHAAPKGALERLEASSAATGIAGSQGAGAAADLIENKVRFPFLP